MKEYEDLNEIQKMLEDHRNSMSLQRYQTASEKMEAAFKSFETKNQFLTRDSHILKLLKMLDHVEIDIIIKLSFQSPENF